MDFVKAFALRLREKGVPTVLLDGTFPPELDPQQCTALPWQPFGNREGCSVDSETVSNAYAQFDQLAYEASASTGYLYYARCDWACAPRAFVGRRLQPAGLFGTIEVISLSKRQKNCPRYYSLVSRSKAFTETIRKTIDSELNARRSLLDGFELDRDQLSKSSPASLISEMSLVVVIAFRRTKIVWSPS